MTTQNQTANFFISHFGLTPNQGQKAALEALAGFVQPENTSNCFILSGPAGSGKTSLLRSVISWLNENDLDFSLSAPTGRAAQIAGKKTQTVATTLHRLLFTIQVQDDPLQVSFIPRNNEKHDDIRYYLVDEASMISDKASRDGMFVQSLSLLAQLIQFARQGNPRNKIIFIGDEFQLPPVHSIFSPALSASYLADTYKMDADGFRLSTVERTGESSYILTNAHNILESITSGSAINRLTCNTTSSFSNGIKRYLTDFSTDPFNQAIMIALANSQVNALNTWARNFRYNYKNSFDIMPDECMICNSNTDLDGHLLFKGNHFTVRKTWKPEEFAGLHFINAEIAFDNHNNERVYANTKILLESVSNGDGMLTFDQEKGLIHEAYRRNKQFRESRRTTDDAFINAVRARYGYAITCHKAQGGEWKNVYLHPGYRQDDPRWLYTAVTRAVNELYTWTEKK